MVFGFTKKRKGQDNSSEAQQPAATAVPGDATPKKSWVKRLSSGLKRTRQNLQGQLGALFLGKKSIDDELFEELETILLTADVGVETTNFVLSTLIEQSKRRALKDPQALQESLQQILLDLLTPCEQPLEITDATPYVILMVGINGAGKTTSIAKLAHLFKSQGKQVILAAGDTFRAAAVEQLQVWGERNKVPVIAQKSGADSASVIFDAMASASTRQCDVLIADTAGRLHTQHHLMDELKKIKRVMGKQSENAPHETLLVLDSGNGQNALQQAKQFHDAIGITGIALTKLDGTAKGGIIFSIAQQLGLPIRFIGVGEQVDDLQPFCAVDFIAALFEPSTGS